MLLQHDLSQTIATSRARFDQAAGPCRDAIVLFGSGPLGRLTLAGLRRAGVEPLAFVDNQERLWGQLVADLPVLSPREAIRHYGQSAVFVVTVFNGSAVHRQLASLGVERMTHFAWLYWKYPQAFPNFGGSCRPEAFLRAAGDVTAFDLWADDHSRREFVEQLQWRLTTDSAQLAPASPAAETYFPSDLLRPSPQEAFVDCGAFDGDSLRAFLQQYGDHFQRAMSGWSPIRPIFAACRG